MAKLTPARKAAYATLRVARERSGEDGRGAYVRDLMNAPTGLAHYGELSDEDRSFATRLVLGVVSTSGTLDEAIDAHLQGKRKLDADVRDALRIAAYEILFLAKEPFVAVSQGVELVRSRAKSAAGLANAVLRRVAENADTFMAQSPAHRYGMPPWLYERVATEHGTEAAQAFGEAGLAQAPTFVANVPMFINDKRAGEAFAAAGVRVSKEGALPGIYRAWDARSVTKCSLVSGEKVQAVVADYGAQAVAYLAAPNVGDRMLEVGSGRGTKTILLAGHAHRAHGAARIWALDVHESKSKIAAERLQKAGVEGVTQITGDARNLDAFDVLPPAFDCILVDAPCSGTGTLRRHPEITWNLSPADVTSCASLQLEILQSCAGRVAVGGRLVYSTCSILAEEDEQVIAAFLSSPAGADFEVVPASSACRDSSSADEIAKLQTSEGYLRTLPTPNGCDGHFCAVLKRKG